MSLSEPELLASEVDVLIAGSGIAGMSAAYEAAGEGLSVLVVEAFDEPGGASAISGAASCIVGTPIQAAQGVADSVELALEDWARAGGPTADLEWALRYLAGSRRELYDWCEQLGIRWDGLGRPENNSAPRGHRPEGGGGAITQAVTRAALARGARLATSTSVVDLIREGDAVAGAVLSRGGRDTPVRAGAVVLATGGFVNNQDMLRRYAPALRGLRRFLSGGAPQANGAGHQLLEALGADFAFPENIWIYPDGTPNPHDPSGQRAVLVRGGGKVEVWLNERGERFHNEALTGGASGSPAIIAQPGNHCWAIFDRSTASAVDLRDDGWYGSSQHPNRERIEWFFATSEYVRQAPGIPELARAIGLPEDTVCAELEAFNAGRDRFGRDLRSTRPIAQPPFYTVEYIPTVQKNLGGVKTDLDCRVLAGGRPMPGLYAAGELAGMAGGHINGSAAIENTMFGPSLFSGRVAGRAVAAGLVASTAGR
jgi:fumarate reductase flavoprotein subunit